MNTPAATASSPAIYDITDIPFFAFSPGLLWWLVLVVALAVVIALIARVPLPRSKNSDPALTIAIRELARIRAGSHDPKEQLADASLLGRRFLTTVTGINLRSATTEEIHAHTNSIAKPLLPLLQLTAEMETQRFSPTVDSAKVDSILDQFSKGLTHYQHALQQLIPQ